MEASVKAEGSKPGDYALIDQDGVKFRLSDYFKDGKPLLVSFIYTSCPDVCPTITAAFKRAVDDARGRFGARFNVLTIGFDPAHDTPRKLKEYGSRFTSDFKSFRLATSDAETIEKLTREFGFFYAGKDDGGFDHIDMVTVVRPDGVIYKQAYSVRTRSFNINNRLEELLTGKPYSAGPPSLLTKIRFFCYKYDPYTGRYVVDYPVILSVFLQAVVILLIVFAVWGKGIVGFFRRR